MHFESCQNKKLNYYLTKVLGDLRIEVKIMLRTFQLDLNLAKKNCYFKGLYLNKLKLSTNVCLVETNVCTIQAHIPLDVILCQRLNNWAKCSALFIKALKSTSLLLFKVKHS